MLDRIVSTLEYIFFNRYGLKIVYIQPQASLELLLQMY